MEQQLSGPQREDALAAIRQVARPPTSLRPRSATATSRGCATWCATATPSDIADRARPSSALEDQVVVFRVLPRKDAAAVFEYLVARRAGSAAQGDGAGGRRLAAQQHGAGRPHHVPRGTAGRGDAAAARAAHAGGTRPSRVTLLGYPEDSIGRLMTPNYVAVREHWTVREVLDYIRDARPGQRNAQRRLRRRRAGRAHRRHPDPRVPADLARLPASRELMDRHFVALKATDDQKTAVAAFRQYDRVGAAGHRHGRHADRHRHDRRRAGRRGSGGDRKRSSASADRKPSTSPTCEIAFCEDGPEAGGLADRAVPRRDADRHGDGRLRGGDLAARSCWRCSSRSSSRAAATRDRRRRRWSSARSRSARSACATGGGSCAARFCVGLALGAILGVHRVPADQRLVGLLEHLRPALAAGRHHGGGWRSSASCCGAR